MFRWWHLFVLDCLFRRLCPLYLSILSFLFKHMEHLFVLGLYVWCFWSTSHTMFEVWLLLLILHNSFESSVWLWCFSCLKDFTWFAYRCLDLVSVISYILCLLVFWFNVKVVLYMMILVKHFSWSGHCSLFMQLQVLSLVLVGGFRTVLLFAPTAIAYFYIILIKKLA